MPTLRQMSRNLTAKEMSVELQIAETMADEIASNFDCKAWIDALCNHLEMAIPGEVCIRICNETESQSLNATYRGIDRPTNVLSFSADVVSDEPILGDLAICWPVLVREADEQRKTIVAHAAHMVIHGVLHLLGYDHQTTADARLMEGIEIAVMSDLGVSNPYL